MADSRRIEELEKLLQEAELRAEKEKRRADASEEQTSATTLYEYIAACHHLVSSKFVVERDRALTSKGSITNPRHKLCPTNLRPWPNFIEQQRIASGALHDAFPERARLFETRNFLSGLGDRISRRPIANEKGLEYFLHNSVEDPVRSILHQLKEVEQIRNVYDMGGGIVFENHPSAISDIAEEVVEQDNLSLPRTPHHGRASNQLRPDQICVYRSDDTASARRNMVYVCEYKAPHKLTAPHLRVGLRPMNIYKEVVNRKTIPTSADPDGRFQYHAERLAAAAISQTYHYMMEGGLEYGLLTTGETIVFLKVDWQEPSTLYYHLAEPGPEVSAHPNNFYSCTAVGQYLAFTLLALGQPGQRQEHGQEERRLAIMGLKTWAEDFESTLRSIPASDRLAPGDSNYEPTTYRGTNRSPYPFRFDRKPVTYDDEPDVQLVRTHSPESSDDEIGRRPPETPSPAERRAGGGAHGSRRSRRIQAQQSSGSVSRSRAGQATRYCTQKCLMGLVKGTFLDMSCPNLGLHSSSLDHIDTRLTSRRHPLSHAKWLQLLTQQLEDSLDNGLTPLGEVGSRGALFRVSLIAYGYVFICKGTVRAFIKDLQHETAVYQRLRPLQGVSVPVSLGSIDLRPMNKIYYYDHRVYIVYMWFMSWGGYKLDHLDLADHVGAKLAAKTLQSLHTIHQAGVVHKDVRRSNMLFNPETNRVMIIDFERSLLVQAPRRALGQIVPNKRKRSFDVIQGKLTGTYRRENRYAPDVDKDIIMAKSVLFELNWYTAKQ
ncbi:Protein kinase-like domain protein [Akanthomyces lecanii RCEF 1005]|uniref:EKC/KEOPS complex subunit BUD32 n=1 Tax=Akanthomyces lecanii RCEF 1005 TaxID=1081108 RepID=A0A168CRU6_CORDF|nr:Protein kinase-like domain protein [Akanthomyces lecanii RCEF 1005]